MTIDLELKIEDALFRVKDLYDKTNGKCCISFSGGKDSTVVAHLVLMAQKRYNLPDISFVFADTKVEYDAIYSFVDWFDRNIHPITVIKPSKAFGQVLKEYGLPFASKMKSQFINTYQKSNAYEFYYMKNALLGLPHVCKDIEGKPSLIEPQRIGNKQTQQLWELYLKLRNTKKELGELIYNHMSKKVDKSIFYNQDIHYCSMFENDYKLDPEYQEYTLENDLINDNSNLHVNSRSGNLIIGERVKENKVLNLGITISENLYTDDGTIFYQDGKAISKERLANKHFHILHPQHEYKIAAKCCDFVKKQPFYQYYKDNDILGYFTGVRIEEGGARAMQYKSCTSTKKVNGIEMWNKMPIFDWTEGNLKEFINEFHIKISDAYTVYGLDRTGWKYAPYNSNIILQTV